MINAVKKFLKDLLHCTATMQRLVEFQQTASLPYLQSTIICRGKWIQFLMFCQSESDEVKKKSSKRKLYYRVTKIGIIFRWHAGLFQKMSSLLFFISFEKIYVAFILSLCSFKQGINLTNWTCYFDGLKTGIGAN